MPRGSGKGLIFAACATCLLVLAPGLASALPVTPIDFNWRAAAPGADPASQWDATIGSHQWSVSGAANGDPGSALPGITGSYSLGAGDSITGTSFRNIASGNPSNEDVSLELWFRPNDMGGGEQILFETGGGGTGLSLLLNDSLLTLRVKNGGTTVTTTAFDLGADASEFFQAAITISMGGTASLYVDGLLAESESAAGIGSWSGGNAAALGGTSGNTGGNDGGDLGAYGDFIGDVALLRFYRDRVLTPGEVLQNYDAVATPEPGSAVFVALGLAALAARRRQLRQR